MNESSSTKAWYAAILKVDFAHSEKHTFQSILYIAIPQIQ